jgi:hypothetical protein
VNVFAKSKESPSENSLATTGKQGEIPNPLWKEKLLQELARAKEIEENQNSELAKDESMEIAWQAVENTFSENNHHALLLTLGELNQNQVSPYAACAITTCLLLFRRHLPPITPCLQNLQKQNLGNSPKAKKEFADFLQKKIAFLEDEALGRAKPAKAKTTNPLKAIANSFALRLQKRQPPNDQIPVGPCSPPLPSKTPYPCIQTTSQTSSSPP